ncbi:TetR/AcrR family transcriptional regulator [Neobacillus dielmonensis]|uniref:TetR/AcrR family transcriptional regulator n=1 Tax=Neobacillus dielmonensis TaxID=1347369 RepID=UPI0005A6F181|nr:TetR/AcrR family transcriptional regulator [Neobacillus dielmonensis]
MDTKTTIINIATALFQEKGYMGVGITEILQTCNISKGSFYHHFPNGKEELLIACLKSIEKVITEDIEYIFNQYRTAHEATYALIEKLIYLFDKEDTLTGYTFASIISELGSLNEPVRIAVNSLYIEMQRIYAAKLEADGFSKADADSLALMMTASVEGGIMLCLTQKTSDPLKTVLNLLPNMLKK